jgi:hypothetical protein
VYIPPFAKGAKDGAPGRLWLGEGIYSGGYEARVVRLSGMVRKRVATAWASLVVLTLAGLLDFYYLAFSVWMMAYPKADPEFWRPRYYQRLGIMVLIGSLWIAVCIWISRQMRPRE